MTEQRAVNVKDAARQLGIGKTLAYELVARGELPAVRLGRRIVIPQHAIDAILAAAVSAEASGAAS